MAHILKPPAPLDGLTAPTVFLAGSIEMGRAEDWQAAVSRSLQSEDIVILNPRRDDWDPTWAQHMDNPPFREQVEWELAAQERATLIVMYFAPSTQSPISLLELGLFARSQKLVVCCPEGFWRKGNVDIVCDRYNVPMVDDLDGLGAAIRQQLTNQPNEIN
ncbi:MAG: nucleoside 2-deoxyribosyltransferase domain-containing protein [Cyanobacteria bacterium]|nr:nucleoside 2-deoxyribosyltransferase domain-containing protein [Cyanobacteriota bacterium]MDA0865751.1 nucleoside 2-deoxyribosyltransferase domain-containing protein [Cyanobacteriota bacterium]